VQCSGLSCVGLSACCPAVGQLHRGRLGSHHLHCRWRHASGTEQLASGWHLYGAGGVFVCKYVHLYCAWGHAAGIGQLASGWHFLGRVRCMCVVMRVSTAHCAQGHAASMDSMQEGGSFSVYVCVIVCILIAMKLTSLQQGDCAARRFVL